MRIEIPDFASKDELFDYLVANKSKLIAQKKKFAIESDVCKAGMLFTHTSATKSNPAEVSDVFPRKLVMNTTNVRDSHGDVHIPGLWNKTLSDNKTFYHLQEHKQSFGAVIDDEAKAYVQTMAWKDLGYDIPGTTQALIFESNISKERNPDMWKAYANGWVKNHSVGMRYIKIDLALSNKNWKDEHELWKEYIGQIANKEETEQAGYFWVVKEAQLLEGSAVLVGSNRYTPTLSTTDGPDTPPEQKSDPIQYLLSKIK